MSVVNSNIKALVAQQSSVKVGRDMSTTMQRLSTGLKINGAKDDAAGLAISQNMTAQVRGLNMAVKNANDAVALLQTAEGSMVEMTNMLQRMRELAVQSANDTNTSEDRQYLNNEFQALKGEFNRIVKNTEWNGMNLLDGTFRENNYIAGLEASAAVANVSGLMKFQIGANANQMISHTFGDYHNSAAIAQSGIITFTTNPELTELNGSAIANVDDVIRLTLNDTVFEVTVTAANNNASSIATAFEALIVANTEVNKLVEASVNATASGHMLVLNSFVKGTAFTVSTSLNEDQSMLNYVETTANATRGFSLLQPLQITNQAKSSLAIDALDHGIQTINQGRADIGATITRLTSAIDNMTTASTNLSDSRSRIMDADYAVESTNLAKAMIVSQAATAMLAQANAQPQSVLALLQ